ncbi:MAG: DUF3658 domain-containing protein [Oscillospiraceae bacterium]
MSNQTGGSKIEIVFSDSALGSLKIAQHYGEGPYQEQAVGIILSRPDGAEPTREEIDDAVREMEQRERAAWENAEPMGGESDDVFGFGLGLSMGDISEDMPGEKRQKALNWLFSIYPGHEGEEITREHIYRAKESLAAVRNRMKSGEALRLWYSHSPDELCGLYWFLAQVKDLCGENAQISLVRLPEWEADACGNIVQHTSWGEIAPGEWHRYLSREKAAPSVFYQSSAAHWQQLQEENAPLRAVLNGQLVSVEETLYDSFIRREIADEDEVFQEAMVIGRVLGKYSLGIGDAWVAHRIEEMIRRGILEPASEARQDAPIYHRMLKKC